MCTFQNLAMMRISWFGFLIALLTMVEARKPEYQRLPPLREQATLKDAWTQERISRIPQILQKYEVGAWLVSFVFSIRSAPVEKR